MWSLIPDMSAWGSDPDRFTGCTYCGGQGYSECEPPDPWCSGCDAQTPDECVCDDGPNTVELRACVGMDS